MIHWREATVDLVRARWPGAAEYEVALLGPVSETIRALAYTDLVGEPRVAGLREAGWLVGTVTVGQAFGGDLEAVNAHTGLVAAAHVLHADVAIVAQGPGQHGHRFPATPGWRPARWSTSPQRWVGGPSPPSVCPKPTRESATVASPTTA